MADSLTEARGLLFSVVCAKAATVKNIIKIDEHEVFTVYVSWRSIKQRLFLVETINLKKEYMVSVLNGYYLLLCLTLEAEHFAKA